MLQLPLCAQDKCSGKYIDQSCSKLKCVQHKLETQEPSQSVLKWGEGVKPISFQTSLYIYKYTWRFLSKFLFWYSEQEAGKRK